MNQFEDMGLIDLNENSTLNLCKSFKFLPEVNYLDLWVVKTFNDDPKKNIFYCYSTIQFSTARVTEQPDTFRVSKNSRVLGLITCEYKINHKPGDNLGISDDEYKKNVMDASLNAKRIETIQSTWAQIERDVGTQDAGIILIKNTFTLAPEAMSLFKNFNQEKYLYTSSNFKAHGLKMITAISAAIGLLNDTDKLVKILKDLGRKHMSYTVKATHYPLAGMALQMTLDAVLGDKFEIGLGHTYSIFYHAVMDLMISGANY